MAVLGTLVLFQKSLWLCMDSKRFENTAAMYNYCGPIKNKTTPPPSPKDMMNAWSDGYANYLDLIIT